MRKSIIWVSLVLGLVLFVVILANISWKDALLSLTHARLDYLLIYLGVNIIIRIVLSMRWHVILRARGIPVPFWRNVLYRLAGFAVSFVAPGPRVTGEVMTAGLATRHASRGKRTKFSKALSTLAIDRSVELQTFAVMFFLGVFVLSLLGDIPSGLKLLLLSASTLLLAIMIFFVINVTRGKLFFTNFVARLGKSARFKREVKHFENTIVTFYREDRKDFVISHLIGAVAWLLSIAEYKYALLLLGLDVPLYGVFIVFSFVGLAYILPVPLAIGTLEGGQAAAFSLIGLSAAAGVVLALITRIRDTVLAVFGFFILLYYGIAPGSIQETVRQ